MSKQLAISTLASVMAMAVFALLAGPNATPQDSPVGVSPSLAPSSLVFMQAGR